MAPNNFVFPPPPPPPQNSYQSSPTYPFNQSRNSSSNGQSGYGAYRGRWQAHGSRVSTAPRGGMNQRQDFGFYGSQQQNAKGAYSSQHSVPFSPDRGPRQPGFDAFRGGFKREHPTAPLAPAAPAVPRFGVPLPSKPFVAPQPSAPIKKRKREHNQLGLTPKQEDHESSEEDVDEEERLARSLGIAGKGPLGLQFTYNGRSSTLNSASELAAWLAERKKRYPTRARAEEERLRRTKAREEAQQAKVTEEVQMRKEKEQQSIQLARLRVEESIKRKLEKSLDDEPKLDQEAKAIRKAEKLRKKYEKAQEQVTRITARKTKNESLLNDSKKPSPIARADEMVNDIMIAHHAAEATGTGALLTPTSQSLSPVIAPEDIVSGSFKGKNGPSDSPGKDMSAAIAQQGDPSCKEVDSMDSLDTTSSGSDSEDDSSDSDSLPEVAASNVPISVTVETPRSRPPKQMKDEICRNYLKNGRCPLKGRCLYKHELPERGAQRREKQKQQLREDKPARTKPAVPRVSLYQRMVLQEKEQEEQNLLDHIIYLGEHGLLNCEE